jgi:hypothetical protein
MERRHTRALILSLVVIARECESHRGPVLLCGRYKPAVQRRGAGPLVGPGSEPHERTGTYSPGLGRLSVRSVNDPRRLRVGFRYVMSSPIPVVLRGISATAEQRVGEQGGRRPWPSRIPPVAATARRHLADTQLLESVHLRVRRSCRRRGVRAVAQKHRFSAEALNRWSVTAGRMVRSQGADPGFAGSARTGVGERELGQRPEAPEGRLPVRHVGSRSVRAGISGSAEERERAIRRKGCSDAARRGREARLRVVTRRPPANAKKPPAQRRSAGPVAGEPAVSSRIPARGRWAG